VKTTGKGLLEPGLELFSRSRFSGFGFGFRPATISFSNKDRMSSKEQKAPRDSQAARPKSYTRTVHSLFTGPRVHTAQAILLAGLTALARANRRSEHTALD